MTQWKTICTVEDIPPNGARCAELGNHQVAVFRINVGGTEEFFAIDNRDPFSKANVLSRGIVGSLQDKIVVASPVYKQHFCLRSGECLEGNVRLRTWSIRIAGDQLQLEA